MVIQYRITFPLHSPLPNRGFSEIY